MFQVRTDLAVEARELYKENKRQEIPGVEVEKSQVEDAIEITRVKIIDEKGSQLMGRPKGSYITIEARGLKSADADLKDSVSKVMAKELVRLLPKKKGLSTFVVGLGNWDVTPDALGPEVVSKILVTRHLFKMYKKTEDPTMSSVSAITPGVMGTTGIETSDIIQGIIQKSKPDLVIAIDALASRKMERVSTTIQISTTGISPGSGVGNLRKQLNEETLGVPVIAIGVPTVVDAATMTNDTISMVIKALKSHSKKGSDFFNILDDMKDNEKYALIKEVLEPYGANVIVTTKEIDKIIIDISQIIANGINIALHPGIDLKDVNRYIN
ncbi:GPR endopeptidase [Paramaledivibacter caminithermalis]|jgi:spore protease|uniref:Germination protease n=1 Tax=Paramaledivibacter caminithermalis (strain DSM 15212 / CIP 107654 / DViRD3) TaxID=1121301 RepID=A0A1M6M6G3_PARC5|nr:GPR endopeptidase [Paramaledivibacter caminithermalis]SHJ79048.1 spore protease [Paramaledivibacter caminithermalis DSM 15212]